MSPISIALNLLLASLLVITLMFGWILNRRLKALKDSHAGFADAVATLDRAAQRAELGLAELRGATDEAVELLMGRITKAREMADNLERLTAQGAIQMERRNQERATEARELSGRPALRTAARALQPRSRAPLSDEAMGTEEDALAAAETLILRLSQTEALTVEPDARRSLRSGGLVEPRMEAAPRPELVSRATPERRLAPVRAEARPNPRSRALIDDDLFEPPAPGRLRAFDGGLA